MRLVDLSTSIQIGLMPTLFSSGGLANVPISFSSENGLVRLAGSSTFRRTCFVLDRVVRGDVRGDDEGWAPRNCRDPRVDHQCSEL